MPKAPSKPPQGPIADPVHFVGIGGSGMSALAELALRGGLAVQGTDLKDSPATERLASLGAKIAFGHGRDEVGDAKTLIYSSAIAKDNPELLEGAARGATVLHRADFLRLLMAGKQAITVAGTHGKSTTSAMVTHVLDALGLDPTAAIGGAMRAYQSPARYGKSAYFVAEADESDGSFLKYDPFISVVTNIDLDHMEYFKDRARLTEAFAAYLQKTHPDGAAVVGWDSPLAREVGAAYAGERLTYGFLLGSEVRGLEFRSERGESWFTAMVERDKVAVHLKMMGKHNAQNALGALAVARALDLDVARAAASLVDFQGVQRRMAHVLDGGKAHVFDDYAHNPGKMAAAVDSLKAAWPEAALHVVFQAHRFSRLETMYEEMLGALKNADFVHVVPVYSAGETTKQDFAPLRLANDLRLRFDVDAAPCKDLDGAAQAVEGAVAKLGPEQTAVVLTLGAGDVWKVAAALKQRLA
jgi:UDP-N-acetylmuramate--alanine ligase